MDEEVDAGEETLAADEGVREAERAAGTGACCMYC